MTPLISELIKLAPDPELYHWFDVGDLPLDGEFVNDAQMFCLPYQRTVVVGRDADGSKFMLSLVGGEISVSVGGLLFVGPYPQDITPFTYINTPEGTRVYGVNGEPPSRAQYMPAMAIVSTFLRGLQKPSTAYVPEPRKSLINSKRRAKGLGPVLFDWHTVTIEPAKPKTDSKGGTHASPRLHDRRGHWRTYPSGKRGWVRDCKVGDASKGAVFKDYRIAAIAQQKGQP